MDAARVNPFDQTDPEEPALHAELQMGCFSSAHSLVETEAVKVGRLFGQIPGPPEEAGETEKVTRIFSSSKCCSKLPRSRLAAQKCLDFRFWNIKAKMSEACKARFPFLSPF